MQIQQEYGRLLESAWNNKDVDTCIQLVKGLHACDSKTKSRYIRYITGSDNIPSGKQASLLTSILTDKIYQKLGPGISKSKGISPAVIQIKINYLKSTARILFFWLRRDMN